MKQKLEYRNGTSNVQLSEQNTGTELYGQDNRNATFTKQYEDQSIYRKSARPRFLFKTITTPQKLLEKIEKNQNLIVIQKLKQEIF